MVDVAPPKQVLRPLETLAQVSYPNFQYQSAMVGPQKSDVVANDISLGTGRHGLCLLHMGNPKQNQA